MLKLKCSLLVLAVFMTAGFVLRGNAHANPVCGTLEECWSLRAYLREQFEEQKSEVVRAFLRPQLDLVNARIEELSQSLDPEKRTSKTGAVFTRDRSHAALGEAWRDPSDLIWGNIVKKTDGTVHRMNHNDATVYCTSIGAGLPSKEELIRLREYMGALSKTKEGYSHHHNGVLPNLWGYAFWSSSDNSYDGPDYASAFNGNSGDIYGVNRSYNSAVSVRCVVAR